MVRLQNVAKRYGGGPEILHDVSFALAPGSFHFVTGAGGSGKTTLLNLIALAEHASAGALTLFGVATDGASRAVRAQLRRRIGVLFQDCRLDGNLNVADNVALPLRIDGAPRQTQRDHVAAMLDWLKISDKSTALPAMLSDAERQRVALARAIVRRPGLLLADEPLAAGDEEVALLLVDAFERMTQLGTTVLVATRDLGFAACFSHPRFHLDGGALSNGEASS